MTSTQLPGHVAAVLFDLDGVLVDSLRVVELAWRRWAGEHGLAAADVLAAAPGRRARDVIALLAPHLDPAAQAGLLASYETQHEGGLSELPGARDCVGAAGQRRWAVVTSGTRAVAVARLTAAGLPVPDVLVTADDVTAGKPDPQPYRQAAAILGVRAAECVVVEDAPAGVLAGKRAGMTVLAVTTTHPAAALVQADLVFTGMAEVSGWLAAQLAGRPPR